MADFPDCLLIVTAEIDAEIDAEVEAEWNAWYDEVHLPAALACPGVLAGRRYVSAGAAALSDHGARGTSEARVYTTVYALSGPEALETPEFKEMRGWYQFAGRIKSRTQVIRAV